MLAWRRASNSRTFSPAVPIFADANTLHSTPIAQQRKVLGDSEVHQSFSHAAKEHKQRAVTRKQNHIDLPKRVHAGEVAYPFG